MRIFLLLFPILLLVGCSETSDIEARLANLEAENAALKQQTNVVVATPTPRTVTVYVTVTSSVTPTPVVQKIYVTATPSRLAEDTVKDVSIRCRHGDQAQGGYYGQRDYLIKQCEISYTEFTVLVETGKGALYTVVVKACELWGLSCNTVGQNWMLRSRQTQIPVRGDVWPPD